MRLLPKNEIGQAKSIDRKLEIDQGAALAKRIDSLRETLAREQSALKSFGESSTAIVQSEIDALLGKRNALAGEVEKLRSQREELAKPLVLAWDKIGEEGKKLDLRKERIMERESGVRKGFKSLAERERTIEAIEKTLREKTLEIIERS